MSAAQRAFVCALSISWIAAAAFARGNLKELTVPLKYTPQEGVHAATVDLPPALLKEPVDIRVEDARKLDDPKWIGQGTGGDDKVFPVHTDDSVIAYVQQAAFAVAKQWSLKLEPTASRTLVIQVSRFAIEESNKAVGSMYGGEVKLAYALKDARGRTLAEGAVSGTAHRYGRAHSSDNINEVMSDALKEAFANVLGDKPLQTAWTSGKPATSSAAESAEERLRKLDELLKKGLITKAEYDKKRSEILKDL